MGTPMRRIEEGMGLDRWIIGVLFYFTENLYVNREDKDFRQWSQVVFGIEQTGGAQRPSSLKLLLAFLNEFRYLVTAFFSPNL
jgi:hypothetical protein